MIQQTISKKLPKKELFVSRKALILTIPMDNFASVFYVKKEKFSLCFY